jgi:hypothetical protein
MTKLPANFITAAVATLDRLWTRAGALTTSEGARAMMQANLSHHLHAGDIATLPLAYIVMMADGGHEPAQKALAEYIATAIDQKRFGELTPGLQDYAKRVLLAGELPGYGRGHKIIDTWTRDITIKFLVDVAMVRWRLKKKQAAYLVVSVMERRGLKPASIRQVLDIYKNHSTIGNRLVAFMLSVIPDDEPEESPEKSGAV